MNNEVRPVRKVDASFCFAIFLSDFLHNFVDGIFIANAFLDCQQSKGWTVASSTVAHELAQEGVHVSAVVDGHAPQREALRQLLAVDVEPVSYTHLTLPTTPYV